MNKTEFKQELLNHGFTLNKRGALVRNFDGMELQVDIFGLFGKTISIDVYYYFKQYLPDEDNLHDIVWNKCIKAVDGNIEGMIIGAIGYEWVNGSIRCKQFENLNGEIVVDYCKRFIEAIKPIMEEYGLL